MENCRACMRNSQNLCSLSENYRESFCSITGVTLFDDTEEYLCKSCLGRLLYAQKFREEAQKTEIWFNEQREFLLKSEEAQYIYEDEELEEAEDVEYLIEEPMEEFLDEISKVEYDNEGFLCDICSNSTIFNTKTDLEAHMKTLHTTQKPLVCEFCGQSFKKFAPFTLHVKSHIQKHEKCPEIECGMTFLQGQDVTKHLKIAHGIDKKPFSCDKCKETFSLATDLTVHVMQRHEKQQSGSKWKCPECEKEFSYPSHLKQHMVSHLGEKNFVCKVCEKSYFKASNLRRHYQNSHLTIYKEMVANGELRRVKADDELELKVEVQKNIKNRRHKCSEPNCNASFNQARHLQEHLESKHGLEVMYQCDDCDSAFEDVINLRLHRKEVHSLKGPHCCDACQKVFSYPSLLRNHIAVVHHGENFFCELCSRSFSRNSHLLRHLREAHTDFYEQNVREGKITPRKSRKKI